MINFQCFNFPFLFSIFTHMKRWTTTNNTVIFRVFEKRSNVYLIVCDSLNILVDTSRKAYYKEITENLKEILDPGFSLDYLILTHTHFDHCENARRLKEEYGCEIIVHKAEADYLQRGASPLPKATMWISRLVLRLQRIFLPEIGQYDPVEPDILIEQDQTPSFCKSLRILHTPGHSVGSICVIVDQEIALVGDTLFRVVKRFIYPPFADQPVNLMQSWNKLLNTPCKLFLPGHGHMIEQEKLTEQYERHTGDR